MSTGGPSGGTAAAAADQFEPTALNVQPNIKTSTGAGGQGGLSAAGAGVPVSDVFHYSNDNKAIRQIFSEDLEESKYVRELLEAYVDQIDEETGRIKWKNDTAVSKLIRPQMAMFLQNYVKLLTLGRHYDYPDHNKPESLAKAGLYAQLTEPYNGNLVQAARAITNSLLLDISTKNGNRSIQRFLGVGSKPQNVEDYYSSHFKTSHRP